MTTHDTAGTARGEMTMDDETTRLRALLRESTELALRLSERVKRAERERDDLAATLETRTAEHALAMEQLAAVTAERDVALGQQAPLLDAHGGTLPRDVHAVFANTDDDVARVIGALTREYVAGGRGADRFFRGAVTLLRTSTVQDLREVARVIDAVCEVANGRNVKVYSETDGGQEETGIGVCQDLPGELNPAGTKLPWEEPSRMIHLLRTSGIGWTRAVFSGDAWVIAPDDAHRLRQIFALLPP